MIIHSILNHPTVKNLDQGINT